MKTWEMIKKIMADRTKRFKSTNYYQQECIVYVEGLNDDCTDVEIMLKHYGEEPSRIVMTFGAEGHEGVMNWDWTEIIEPVDFITAYNDCLENGTKYIPDTVDDSRNQEMYKHESGVYLEDKYCGEMMWLSCKWIKKV